MSDNINNNTNTNKEIAESLIRVEIDTSQPEKITVLTPICPNCNIPMEGMYFKFYQDENMGKLYTESLHSIFWTEFLFQCKKCWFRVQMSDKDVEILNSYSLDNINMPPGFDRKNLKVQRMGTK